MKVFQMGEPRGCLLGCVRGGSRGIRHIAFSIMKTETNVDIQDIVIQSPK